MSKAFITISFALYQSWTFAVFLGLYHRAIFSEDFCIVRELEHQPVEYLGCRATNLMVESRAALAVYLGVQRDDLSYVTNATMEVNIVARSLNLGPGGEVLATDYGYGACDRAWRFLSQKKGFT